MEEYQVYDDSDVEKLVDLFLSGAERDRLDPILDAYTAVYKQLELDDQIKFKRPRRPLCVHTASLVQFFLTEMLTGRSYRSS